MLLNIHQGWQWFYDHEEPRFILWAPVFLAIGISWYFADVPALGIAVMMPLLVMLTALSIFMRWFAYLYRHWGYAMTLVCLGYSLIVYTSERMQTPFIQQTYQTIFMQGTIDHIESRPGDWRLTLKDIVFQDQNTPPLHKVRLVHRIKQPDMVDLIPGDRIKVLATLNPPKPPAFAGAYDFRQQAYYSGLSASGFIQKRIEKVSATPASFWQTQRHRLTQFFESSLIKPQGAIAAALVTGERGGIPSTLRDAYADAGIAHILAISGLHVSIVAGIVFFIFRKLLSLWIMVTLRYDIKKLAAGLAIAFTFCYMQLSGASYPAVRSFIMISLILMGVIIDRPAVTLRNVTLAALAILLMMPHALISPSFQLSFSAVIGLTAIYENLRHAHWAQKISMTGSRFKKFLGYFFGLGLSSLIATIATTPYTIYTFHRFTLVALLSNLIAIPLISFAIMPLILMFLILACFGWSHLVAWPLNYSLMTMNSIASYCSTLPLAHIKLPMFSGLSLGMMTIGLLWVLFWQSWIKWLGFIIVGWGCLQAYYFEPLPDLFISSQRKLICYFDGQVGYVNSRQSARFDRTLWQDALALTAVQKPLPSYIQIEAEQFIDHDTIPLGALIWRKHSHIKWAYTVERPWNKDIMQFVNKDNF